MTKKAIFSVIAAVLFLCGLVLMLFVAPYLSQNEVTPTEPFSMETTTTEPTGLITEPTTEPPTEPTTEAPTYPAAETMAPSLLNLTAQYGFAYDCGTQRFLYIGGDPNAPLAPASLTKLLTAYVVLQHMGEGEVVTVGEEVTWIDPLSSVAFLQPGHKLTVRMLVQGLIMQSGNDAAYTLAVACGRRLAENPKLDSREAWTLFVEEMNAVARLIGMENSQFKNPDGNDEEGHYTTVNDLVTMALVAMQNPTIMEYACMASADVVFASGETCTWFNSNYLLHQDKPYFVAEAIGLKTGSTTNAGKCLISLFLQEDGTYLMVGVLGSETDDTRYEDTLILYNRYR